LGSDIRGNAVATYVVASASDGYQVVFSLAELDPAFTGSEVIVADTIDGKSLFASRVRCESSRPEIPAPLVPSECWSGSRWSNSRSSQLSIVSRRRLCDGRRACVPTIDVPWL
jgi:hypothetical protein